MKSRAAIVLAALAAIGCVQAAETCVPACNEIYKPVCGSDGKTYENQCTFDYKKCSTNDTALKVVSEGECGSSSGSAGGTVCEKGCTKIMKPVCGSDGKTYSNDCELTNAKCKNATLTKVSDGECGSSAGSGNVGCGSTKCTSDYTPVCGSDGKTYSNECQLKVAQCSDPSLKLDSNGECSGFSRTGSIGGEASLENSTDPSPTPSSTVPSPTSAPTSGAVVVAAVQVVASTLLAAVALLN